MRALAIAACAILAACGSTTAVKVQCIPLTTITPAQMTAVADEIAAAPTAAVFPLFVADWVRMRDADRACMKPGP